MGLNELVLGGEACIERLAVDDLDASVLRAMGVVEGQSVRVLRRAPFGGPLHIRVGEAAFALDRSLAAAVVVRPGPAP